MSLALDRDRSNSELGELLRASYRSHASSSLPHCQNPATHKPNALPSLVAPNLKQDTMILQRQK